MKTILLALVGLFTAAASPAQAAPTEVVVRVISQDAKFIGDSTGGVEAVLRDAKTRKVLARGVTAGGTGDTRAIMQPAGRSSPRSSSDAAKSVLTIDIDQPVLVDLEVQGPRGRPGSAVRIVSQRWIMPGQHVNIGDGWVVELPGLAISSTARLSEPAGAGAKRQVLVEAKVELLCGCPITPGGMWNATDYRVEVTAWRRGRLVSAAPLAFVQAPGGFAGALELPDSKPYTYFIMARNVITGNSGVVEFKLKRR